MIRICQQQGKKMQAAKSIAGKTETFTWTYHLTFFGTKYIPHIREMETKAADVQHKMEM